MTICYPSVTDWSCAIPDAEMVALRADEKTRKIVERCEALAWYTLASLTAYRIGVCPVVVRPCAAGGRAAGSWLEAPVAGGHTGGLPTRRIGSFVPYVTGGEWVNGCGCGGDCDCSSASEVILPGPVGAVERVTVGGEVISPARYRIDDGNRLVSLDSELIWPLDQDASMPADAPGSFVVTYYQGAAPNELTAFAAGKLAHEFYLACTKGKCSLPVGVTTVVRQGVSFEIEHGLFENGYTGIKEVDSVIRIYNPNALRSAPRVLSPESRAGAGRRTTWGRF